ncbi:MAG: UbiD family decarboxylase [Planctomycetaceae bacterium]|nr:UbiD family decarboxylase [Planctomycetaceae bacterium]
MAYETLNDFLSELESRSELLRVSSPVSSRFEIAAITRELTLQSDQAPALIFDQVDGQSIPVVMNLLGTRSRMLLALRVEQFSELANQIIDLISPEIPDGWKNALQLIPRVTQLMKLPPVESQTGRSQQVVRIGKDVNLGNLPIPYSWRGEAGPVITAGTIHAQDPLSGTRILTAAPLELTSHSTLALHIHPGQDLYSAVRSAREAGQQLPIAVSIGVDPAIWFAAHLPLPRGTDPTMLAGFFRNKPLELVPGRTQEISVPANAEMIIEGYLDANEPWQSVGPIAAPTGFYSPEETMPTVHVTALTHCTNPLWHSSLTGPPPQETEWIGRATEQIFLPLAKIYIRDLVDLHWAQAGMFRNWLFVSIRKTHPQHARQVMHAIWGLHGLSQAKMIVVVDEDVDVSNENLIWHLMGTHVNPQSDCVFADLPADAYDHACPRRYVGQKMGFDATRKLPEEGYTRNWPERVEIPEETRDLIRKRWQDFGLPGSPRKGATP